MSDCVRCNQEAYFCARHAYDQAMLLKREVDDLKARLRAVAKARDYDLKHGTQSVFDKNIGAALNLRRKNWEKL